MQSTNTLTSESQSTQITQKIVQIYQHEICFEDIGMRNATWKCFVIGKRFLRYLISNFHYPEIQNCSPPILSCSLSPIFVSLYFSLQHLVSMETPTRSTRKEKITLDETMIDMKEESDTWSQSKSRASQVFKKVGIFLEIFLTNSKTVVLSFSYNCYLIFISLYFSHDTWRA
jgi:hypothetical protein